MGSPLPPDPYLALGVAKDASAGTIKTQYRKLVLKFHPDKVTGESQKKAAADEFHKIQTAYEIIGDEDKRQRYDAQVKLAELRRDVMERGGGRPDVKTAAYKSPTEAARATSYHARGPERVSPTYEERKPSYAHAQAQTPVQDDYFPRKTAHRDDAYERSARYQAPREQRDDRDKDRERERPRGTQKSAKETERSSRREKTKQVEKEVKRERERKTAAAEIVSDTSSDSDEYERAARRRMREDSEAVKRAREQYFAQAQRQQEEAARGAYKDERAKKMFSHHEEALEHINRNRRQESERRPSPIRQASSSRDKYAYGRQGEARPTATRRDSQRPKTVGREGEAREQRRSAPREPAERRSSAEIVDDVRKPALTTARSSPAEIRIPSEKPRSQSVQVEKEDMPIPGMRRAETMPSQSTPRERDGRSKKDAGAPQKGSGLRQTEFPESIPTPTASPGEAYTAHPDPNTFYRYRQQYADDVEYPTPDGYKTEVREPGSREKPRPSSSRHAQHSPPLSTQPQSRPAAVRTTSKSYQYQPTPNSDSYTRSVPSRDHSGQFLYGEMPSSRSPKQAPSKYPPSFEQQYRMKTEDINPKTGYPAYTRRPSEPVRQHSYTNRPQPMAAR